MGGSVSAKKETRSPSLSCPGIHLIPNRGHVLSGKDGLHYDADGSLWVPGRRYFGTDAYPLDGVGKMRAFSIPEREGSYRIAVDVCLPRELLSDGYQVEVRPEVVSGEGTTVLPGVKLTGARFRKVQMKQYRSMGMDLDELCFNEGVGLDTTCFFGKTDVVYRYVREVPVSAGLEEMKFFLSVFITDGKKKSFSYERCDSLLFLPSSLRTFVVDDCSRMGVEVTEVSNENTSYKIEFPTGRTDVQMSYRGNAAEFVRLKNDLMFYFNGDRMRLDSVLVAANASPDGNWNSNLSLATKRGERVALELESFLAKYVGNDYTGPKDRKDAVADLMRVRFKGIGNPENWSRLEALVEEDAHLTESQKDRFISTMGFNDPDERERRMQRESYYQYMKDKLYPLLRTVDVSFFLSRNSARLVPSREGVEAYRHSVGLLRQGKYGEGVSGLDVYEDYNTAVGCALAGDYDRAVDILLAYRKVPAVCYLLGYCMKASGQDGPEADRYIDMAADADINYLYRAYLDGLK